MPHQHALAEALAAWRAAERLRDELPEFDAVREAAEAEVARLRDEYHRLVDLRAGASGDGK